MLFINAYEQYKIYAKNRHKKQGFITITQDFNKNILPYFRNFNIEDITKKHILDWQTSILSNNFSNKYNAKLYYCFNNFMQFCVNSSFIDVNLVREIGSFPRRIENKKHRVYNFWQFIWFYLHLDNFIIKNYFMFIYFYGTRPGEAMALRFCDIKHNKVFINHNLTRKGNRFLDTPKNQSSIRVFKINFIMRFVIYLLKKSYNDCKLDYFVFGGNKPLAPTTIDRHKKNACINAHLFEITQHEFRHSYATRMVNKKNISFVSKSLGHSRISTTLDIYVH